MARNATRILLGLLTTGIMVGAGLLAGLYLGGATWTLNRVLAAVNPYPGTTLRSARVGGNLFRVIRVYDVRLTRPEGEVMVRLDSLTLTYDARSLLGRGVVIREARLDGPSVLLSRGPDSTWNLLDLPRRRSDSSVSRSAGPDITIERLAIARGSARVRFAGVGPAGGHRVEDLEAEGAAITIGPGISVGRAALRLRLLPQDGLPAWVALEARGSLQNAHLRLDTLSVRSPASAIAAKGITPLPPGGGRRLDVRRLGIHLTARPLAWSDLRFLKPELDRPGSVSLSLNARGEGDGALVRLTAESSDGGSARLEGFLTSPGVSPMEYRGEVTLRGVDPSLVTLDPSRGDRVNGEVRIDVRGPRLDRLDGRARVRLFDSRYRSFRTRELAGEAELSAGRSDIDLEGELGPIRMVIDGWLRAFDSVPTYDLAARVARAPRGARSVWLDRLLGSGGSQLLLTVGGREVDPDRADLGAVVRVLPGPLSPGLLDSGYIQARLAAGMVDLRGRVGATGGLLTLRGRGRLGGEPRYRIEGEIGPGLDLAALLGGGTPSTLAGTFSLDGRGTRRETLRGRASVSVSGSYGSHHLAGTQLKLELASGTARLDGRGFLDGASVELGAVARPFDSEPALTVRSLRFRHLDLARIAPGSGLGTDLTGTGTLSARGRKLDRLRLSGQLLVEPSRIRAIAIDSGAIVGSLSRGDLDLRVDVAAPAGALALAGTGRPLDSAPRYTVREATFHDVELGQLLDLDGLHTRLAGSLRVEGSGRRSADATLDGSLSLGPSTVNQAAIREGDFRVGLAAGRLHLRGKLMGDGDSVMIDASTEPFVDPRPVRLESAIAIRDLGPLLARGDLEAGVATRLTAEGVWGERDSIRLEGTLLGSGRFEGLSLDAFGSKLGLSGGTLMVDSLDLRSNVGAVTAAGTIGLFGPGSSRPSALRAQATLSDLAPLGSILGLEGLALDSGQVTLSLEGSRDQPSLRADVEATGLAIGGRRVAVVHGSLWGELAPDRSIGTADGDLLLERVYAPGSPASNVRIQGSYGGEELALRAQVDQYGRRSAWIAARAYPGSGEGRVELDSLEVRSETESWSLAHPVRMAYGKQILIDDLILSSGRRRIAVDGNLDREGQQDLRVQLDSFPVGWLAGVASLPPVDGEINGSLALSGAAASPRLTGGLDVALESRGKKVGRTRATLDWAGQRRNEHRSRSFPSEGRQPPGHRPVAPGPFLSRRHLWSRAREPHPGRRAEARRPGAGVPPRSARAAARPCHGQIPPRPAQGGRPRAWDAGIAHTERGGRSRGRQGRPAAPWCDLS